jgi:hypothetical protein
MFTNVSEVLAASIIALRMEAASTSETSVNFYQTKRRYKPENSHLHIGFIIILYRKKSFKNTRTCQGTQRIQMFEQ